MSPEQVAGLPVSPATDVFALGQLAFFAATGRPAFGDGNPVALVHRIANEPPNLADCPQDLRQMVERCLAKDPAGRPSLNEVVRYAQAGLAGAAAGAGWLPDPVAATLASYDPGCAPSPAPSSPSVAAAPGPREPVAAPFAEASPDGPRTWGPGLAGMTSLPARRRRRWPYAAAVGAAFLTGILVTAVGCQSTTTVVAPPSSTAAQSAVPAPAPTTDQPTPTDPASSLAAGYTQEYRDTKFTMPGGGCSYWAASEVTFGEQGPQVQANSDGGDFYLNCNNTGSIAAAIVFSGPVSLVTGNPDAANCRVAIDRDPISGTVSLSQLAPGAQFCLEGSSNQQLVLVTLVSKGNATYDLTWKATAWLIPSGN